MSYPINLTSGNVLLTLQDGTVNTDTGLTLIGRNYTGFGEAQNENFVHLLENFADNIPPGQSRGINILLGTIWYDSANNLLKTFDGTNWNVVSGRIASDTAPVAKNIGDQWWDNVNGQLRTWDGTQWYLVGPPYTKGQGKSGAIVETVTDTVGNTHVIVSTYTNNHRVSITSYDTEFTPATTITGYPTIKPGISVSDVELFNGTANNALSIGGVTATVLARTDINSTFTQDISVAGNIVLNNANLFTKSGTLTLQNNNYGANVEIYVNSTTTGNTRAFYIGSDGKSYVATNPTANLGIATKGYADSVTNIANAYAVSLNNVTTQSVNQLRADTFAAIGSNVTVLNNSIASVNNSLTADMNAVNTEFGNIVAAINSINAALNNLAAIDSPSLTGVPTAPTANIIQVSSAIVNGVLLANTKATLDANLQSSVTALTSDYTSQIASASATAATNLSNSLVTKANIASPVFTGIPKAPTPPATIWTTSGHFPVGGDNSQQLATTAYVNSTVSGQKLNYTVSTQPPSGGVDGDFWFQIST